jgi:amidase
VGAACGSPLDLGSDTGGSIRLPAHFCGIAGIRPTGGRVPRTGLIVPPGTPVDSVTVVGPMARTVEDLIVALGVIGGPDAIDAAVVPMPLGDAFNSPLRRLRVAMYVDDGLRPAEPDVAATVRAAADVLGDAGAAVVESTPPGVEQSMRLLGRILRADRRGWLMRLLDSYGTTEHEFEGIDEQGSTASDYFDALVELEAFRSAMLTWVQDFDLVVCPPHANTALPPGAVTGDNYHGAGYLRTYNITGWPAAVVRAGTTGTGLPVGVQLVAPPWQDHVALAAALEVERVLGGWRPPAMAAL